MRSVLLDCDDVLLDWIGGFRGYASRVLQREVVGEPQSWHMGEWLRTSDEVAVELIEEFNTSSHFGRLAAVEGSGAIVEQMFSDEVPLHVITSCSSDPATVELRRANLKDIFGPDTFDSVHCLDLGQSKLKVLQAFEPGCLWVEDNYKNAIMGADAGHTVLMRKRPHNAEFQDLHDTRIHWFENWSEVGEYI